MTQERILITGGAGFIGSHLCDLLLSRGKRVSVIDNLYLGRRENIAHLMKNPDFEFIEHDVLDTDFIKAFFSHQKISRVYHLAANSDIASSIKDRSIDLKLNLQTTHSVLEGMLEGGCKEIVFASTSAIYGDVKEKLHEDFGPLFPVSFYGASKLAAEAYISVYSHSFGIRAWITRFPNVVGERATHGVILDFVRKLRKNPGELEVLGDGNQMKPYLYVKDLCDAIEYFISKTYEQENPRLHYVNLGTETRTRVREIAEMVIEEMGLKARIRYTGGKVGWVGDVPEFNYSLDKIHKLGWKAPTHSNLAVRKSIQGVVQETRP